MCLIYGSEARTDNKTWPALTFPSQLQLQLQLGPDGTSPHGHVRAQSVYFSAETRAVNEAKQDSFLLVVEHSNRRPELPLTLFLFFSFLSPLSSAGGRVNYSKYFTGSRTIELIKPSERAFTSEMYFLFCGRRGGRELDACHTH